MAMTRNHFTVVGASTDIGPVVDDVALGHHPETDNDEYGTEGYWRALLQANAARATQSDIPSHDALCEGKCYRCAYDAGMPAIVRQVTEAARMRGEAIQAEADTFVRLAHLAASSPTGRVAQDGRPC